MPQLLIKVQNKIAKALNDFIVCGNSDYTVKFCFDKEWDKEPIKTARFIWSNQYQDVVFEGDTCKIPVIDNATTLGIGVFAGSLKTTTPAIINCTKSVLSGLGCPSDPPEDVYNQIIEILNEGIAETSSDITALKQKHNTDILSLQNQIDNIVIEASESGDVAAEVVQARVSIDGTNHDTLKGRVDAIETDLDNYSVVNSEIDFSGYLEVGGLNTTDGAKNNYTNRVRTTVFLPRSISRVVCDSGYLFYILVYDKDNTFIGRYCTDGSIKPEGDGGLVLTTLNFDFDSLKRYPDYRFKICFRTIPGTKITLDEVLNHAHFYNNNRNCYVETFYMDRVRLSSIGNIIINNIDSFTANDFYKSWHTKEMIYVDPGTAIKISCDDATNIKIFQFNKDNVFHSTLDVVNNELVTLSPNCVWIRISVESNEDKISLHKPVTVQWETSNYNVLTKHRYCGANSLNIVFPVPDVHGMRDISETDEQNVAQYNSEIGYSSGLFMLPPNYSQTGKPVDVIIACHSSGGYFNFADKHFYSGYLPFYQYMRDEGYMVVDFWGHSSFAPVTATRPKTYGNPDNMACYEWGIKYILDNFNVNPKGIFVTCKSLGGEVGLNLAFSNTAVRPAAVGMLAPAFNLLRRSLGYTKEERFENAWAWGFEGDTGTILGDETTKVDYGTIPAETEAYKTYMKTNAPKLMGYNPMWNGLIGANLDELCDWSFNLGEGDMIESNWSSLVRVCPTPIKIWDAIDDMNTPYSIAKNFVTTLKNGGCMAELRTMPTGTGGHYSVDIGTENNPSIKVENVTTRLGIVHNNIPLAYVELVNYFRRFSS